MTTSDPAARGAAAFDAVIFDQDGILIETEALWDEVRRALAADDGATWPETATTDMMGMSTPEWAEYMVETVGCQGPPDALAQRVIERMAERYRDGIPRLSGAAEAVRRMADSGRQVAIVSSSPRRLIDTVAGELGIADLLGTTVSTEEAGAGKPAPDGYLKACRELGVEPSRAVGVEDSTNGLKSLLNAGMAAVAVPPDFHPPADDVLARVDAVLDTLDELNEALLEHIGAQRG